MARLPAFIWAKYGETPSTNGRAVRVTSPSGGSTLVTSAPRSASSRPHSGPETTRERSSTLIPASGMRLRSTRRYDGVASAANCTLASVPGSRIPGAAPVRLRHAPVAARGSQRSPGIAFSLSPWATEVSTQCSQRGRWPAPLVARRPAASPRAPAPLPDRRLAIAIVVSLPAIVGAVPVSAKKIPVTTLLARALASAEHQVHRAGVLVGCAADPRLRHRRRRHRAASRRPTGCAPGGTGLRTTGSIA